MRADYVWVSLKKDFNRRFYNKKTKITRKS